MSLRLCVRGILYPGAAHSEGHKRTHYGVDVCVNVCVCMCIGRRRASVCVCVCLACRLWPRGQWMLMRPAGVHPADSQLKAASSQGQPPSKTEANQA